MKIAIVSLQFDQTATGGGGVHVKHISKEFLKQGQEITVLSIHTDKTLQDIKLQEDWLVPYSIQTKDGLVLVRFLIDKGIGHPYVGTKDVELNRIQRFADIVIKWIKERPEEFDIINLHGHHIIPGYIAKELKGIKPKVISYIHALETTYVTGDGKFVGAFDGTDKILSRIREWEAMCCHADFAIVNSPIVRDEFKAIVKESKEDITECDQKTVLISSGCDESFLMEEELIKNKLSNIPEKINLVTFCRIDPSKGVEFSIKGAKAAARFSSHKFCLTIAGIPSSDEYIKQLKNELDESIGNLEVKFRLLDAISPTEEKKEILDDKHIYILPTLKEPFGMSVIEASARANMVISADTNGPKFMFEMDSRPQNLEWGVVTDFGILARITEDPDTNFEENIGKAINWTIDNWSQNIDRVLKFNEKIRNTWTWESIAKQYLELFNK